MGSVLYSKVRELWRNVGSYVFSGATVRVVGATTVLLLVFGIGVGVGSGRLHLTAQRQSSNASLPNKLDYSSVDAVYRELKNNYDGKLTAAQLIDGLKQGLTSATGDPYTQYFTPTAAKDFNSALNNSFSGIGAELGKDADDNLVVVSPIAGFPAAKAGLRAKDIITEVDKQSTSGLSIDAAVTKIRGPKDTKVTLTIIRDHAKKLTFTITRQNIKLPSVDAKILPGNIGYMAVTTFGDDTANLAEEAASTFTNAHVKGIVLDLRGNPGGLVESAVRLSSLWLPVNATVLQEKRENTVTQVYRALGGNVFDGIPTVVLIDGGSASASEIVAGALRDNKVAVIMGAKSYGKGSVQELRSLPGGAALKVTVARWYRPNGQNIDKKGITPDTLVTLKEGDIAHGKDTQKEAALEYLRK